MNVPTMPLSPGTPGAPSGAAAAPAVPAGRAGPEQQAPFAELVADIVAELLAAAPAGLVTPPAVAPVGPGGGLAEASVLPVAGPVLGENATGEATADAATGEAADPTGAAAAALAQSLPAPAPAPPARFRACPTPTRSTRRRLATS